MSLTCHVRCICSHSNQTRARISNPPNSAQLGDISYHFAQLHSGPCSSMGMRRGTDRHTDTQTHRRPWPMYISPRLRLSQNMTVVQLEMQKHTPIPECLACNLGKSFYSCEFFSIIYICQVAPMHWYDAMRYNYYNSERHVTDRFRCMCQCCKTRLLLNAISLAINNSSTSYPWRVAIGRPGG